MSICRSSKPDRLLAELAGLPAPSGPQPIDGISLVPVLRDPVLRVRDHTFHVFPKAKLGRAIRNERYRLIEWRKPGQPETTSVWELYDLQEDPDETKNLATERSEVVEELKGVLAGYGQGIAPR